MAGPPGLSSDHLTVLRRLADEHLPVDVAARWLRLVRPAVHLLSPGDAGDDPAYDALPLVGRLGGTPLVPPDFSWPVWPGHGPLPLVAEIDLAAVAAAGLEPGIALPRVGRLLAFYYDGPFLQDPDGMVWADEPESMAGMRLLHLDDDPDARVTPGVAGLHVYPERPLRGRQAWTHPHWMDPALARAFDAPDDFGDHRGRQEHPVTSGEFADALGSLRAPGVGPDDVHHQLGGWAQHVQAAVETEVADDPLRWRPVLQVGSEPRRGRRSGTDAAAYADDVLDVDQRGPWPAVPEVPAAGDPGPDDEMTFDDLGALYWLARDDDLPGLTDVRFTHQSG